MTRLMGDAIHAQVPTLAAVPGLELVAGYVTGSPDIQWTMADWDHFAPLVEHLVTIDQGFTGAPRYDADVIDVETGANPPSRVPGWMARATAPRPAVYCNRDTLPSVLATGWRGCLWLAIPGWQPGQALPAAPGCTIVAVQNNYDNPAYDLSVVLDPTWPEAMMPIPEKPADVLQTLNMWSNPDGSLAWLYVGTDGYAYTRFDPGFKGWGPAVKVA